MKKIMILIALSLAFTGCAKQQSNEEKVKEQITEKVYPLNADERQAAAINAKAYFEKTWAIADNARGQFNDCRPSDSNANGLVTCHGFVPKPGGGYTETKMFCGYRPELVGCSDEDTVK